LSAIMRPGDSTASTASTDGNSMSAARDDQFRAPGVRGTPLGKLLRQLRIERDEFALCPRNNRASFLACRANRMRFTMISRYWRRRSLRNSRTDRRFRGSPAWCGITATHIRWSDVRAREWSASISPMHCLRNDFLSVDVLWSAQDTMTCAVAISSRPVSGRFRAPARRRAPDHRDAEKYGGWRRTSNEVWCARIVERDGRPRPWSFDDGRKVTADHVISSIGAAENACAVRRTACGSSPRRPRQWQGDLRSSLWQGGSCPCAAPGKPTGRTPVHDGRRLSFIETSGC